jgi:hypothetical protein
MTAGGHGTHASFATYLDGRNDAMYLEYPRNARPVAAAGDEFRAAGPSYQAGGY